MTTLPLLHASFLLLRRLGLDVPLTALAWGYAVLRLNAVPVVTDAPLLAVCSVLWSATFATRVLRTRSDETTEEALWYRRHIAGCILMLTALCCATLWVLGAYVGQSFLYLLIVPLLCALPGAVLPRRFGSLFLSVALAMLCLSPTAYESMTNLPLQSPALQLGVFFFIGAELLQPRWPRWFGFAGLMALVGFSISRLLNSDGFEHSLSMVIIIGAAWMQGITKLRPREASEAGAMPLLPPALLSLLL